MRPSLLRHPLALLRKEIGLGQKGLAQLVGRSTATIQAIEIGKLNLGDELAIQISVETGVSAQWLKNGDPQATPIPNDLNPIPPGHPSGVFTKEYFERRRADRMEDRDELNKLGGATIFDVAKLCAVSASAVESGNARLARYRISKFLDEMKKEFGQSKKVYNREMKKGGLWIDLATRFQYPDGGHDDKAGDEPKWAAAGEPAWANYREFVPAFNREYAKLKKLAEKRAEKGNPQEPGILPALQWISNALRVNSPELAKQVLTQDAET